MMDENNRSWGQKYARLVRWGIAIICITTLIAVAWILHKEPSHDPLLTPYQTEDRTAIIDMLRTDWYWLVGEGVKDFSPEYMLDHQAATWRYPDKSLSIMIYRDTHGLPVGFVTYHKLEALKGRIQFLAVARHARKKGIAQKLISYAIEELRKQGFCSIEIAVRVNNIPAKTLYIKNGFTETWRTSDGFLGLSKNLCS